MTPAPGPIRRCRPDEAGEILAIVNAAAEAYRGVIPEDCWHDPYMPAGQLDREIAAGVGFWGVDVDGRLAGVMGVQPVKDVELIRHAYVLPACQGAGVGFWGVDVEGRLAGVMGVQPVKDVELIRHAYVLPACQGAGIGGGMLDFLKGRSAARMLVGTWAAATWAIRLYERHGFRLVAPERTPEVLRTYWTITDRQIETSVVLADPPLDG